MRILNQNFPGQRVSYMLASLILTGGLLAGCMKYIFPDATALPLATTPDDTSTRSLPSVLLADTETPGKTTHTPANPLVKNPTKPGLAATWTPVPTLPRHLAEDVVQQLLEDNGGCHLPCWFGITPGESTWEEANNILSPIGTIINDGPIIISTITRDKAWSLHYFSFVIPGQQEGGAMIEDRDGVVSLIRVGPNTTQSGKFSFGNILEEFGEPDQIFLRTTHHFPFESLPFRLVLLYHQDGVIVDFDLDGRSIGNEICASPLSTGPFLWLYSQEIQPRSGTLPSWFLQPGELPPLPLEETTNMDTAMFYRVFHDPDSPNQICVPKDE